MNVPTIIEQSGQRVLTTAQLAEAYDTTEKRISENFVRNKEHYQEGKHFYYLDGEVLKEFLQSANCGTQNENKVRSLYLWTEHGALLHAKSLNTDKAWEVYEFLVDSYFRTEKQDSYLIDDKIKRAERWIQEQQEKKALETTVTIQAQQIAELQPKASYYDLVLNCSDLLSTTVIAKDYGQSAYWLNSLLEQKGIQYHDTDIWLLYAKYARMGLTSTKTHTYYDYSGQLHMKPHTYWTPKGRLFIYDLLKKDGILPIIETMQEEEANT
jgi:phage antirepressor YoqD-like protein